MENNPYQAPRSALEEAGKLQDRNKRDRSAIIDIYFSPKGRLTRKVYFFAFLLPLMVIGIGAGLLLEMTDTTPEDDLLYLLCAPLLWISIVGSVKRLHDFGLSGWFYLATFVPLLGYLFSAALIFFPGTNGENRYGPDPRGN